MHKEPNELFFYVREVTDGTSGVVRMVIKNFFGVKVNGSVCTDDHRVMQPGDVIDIDETWVLSYMPSTIVVS